MGQGVLPGVPVPVIETEPTATLVFKPSKRGDGSGANVTIEFDPPLPKQGGMPMHRSQQLAVATFGHVMGLLHGSMVAVEADGAEVGDAMDYVDYDADVDAIPFEDEA